MLAGSGEHVPASGILARGDNFEVPYRVVDRISGFAGSGPWQTVMVVDQDVLLALAPPGSIDVLEAELWSAEDADTVARAARAADLTVSLDATADEVRADHSTLVARSWVTSYLQAFMALALVLGLLVLAGLQRRDREQRRLQDRTLADLGHPGGWSRAPPAPRCRSWPCWARPRAASRRTPSPPRSPPGSTRSRPSSRPSW